MLNNSPLAPCALKRLVVAFPRVAKRDSALPVMSFSIFTCSCHSQYLFAQPF